MPTNRPAHRQYKPTELTWNSYKGEEGNLYKFDKGSSGIVTHEEVLICLQRNPTYHLSRGGDLDRWWDMIKKLWGKSVGNHCDITGSVSNTVGKIKLTENDCKMVRRVKKPSWKTLTAEWKQNKKEKWSVDPLDDKSEEEKENVGQG